MQNPETGGLLMTEGNVAVASLESRARRRYPDHRLNVSYPVCLPVYELRLRVTELREHELSTTARFILQLVNLGVRSPDEIGSIFGLPENYVAGAAVELLEADLAFQDGRSDIAMTNMGRKVLKDGGRWLKPRNWHVKVPYDPLTKRIADVDVEQLRDRELLRKEGQFIVSAATRPPRFGSVRIEQVRNYIRNHIRRHVKSEVLEVVDIKGSRKCYRDDVTLVKLDGPGSTPSIFAAYRSHEYLSDESAAIQRLAERGGNLVPDEYQIDDSLPRSSPVELTNDEAKLIDAIKDIDGKLLRAEDDAERGRVARGSTQSSAERRELEMRIARLESEKAELTGAVVSYERQLHRLNDGETCLIRTEQHRELLLHAITTAQMELTLVSAWITERAFDDEICRLLTAAIGRGVRVRIGWGLGAHRRRGPDVHRNRAQGMGVLKKLRGLIPTGSKRLLVERRAETHEKYIICDSLFCAWGSFNWLSYRGKRDSGYRRETSFYSEREADVALWKDNATTFFGK